MKIDYRNVRRVAYYILSIGILAAVASMILHPASLALPIAILALFSLVYVFMVFWYYRCPHCGKPIPTMSRYVPDYCPYCRKGIDD